MTAVTRPAARPAAPAAPTVPVVPRLKNPGETVPEALEGIQKLLVAVHKGGVPRETLDLCHLRASQINGCGACVEGAFKHLKKNGGEVDVRLYTVATWRESPHFTAAERAALALTEAVTRLADRPDPVPDEIWNDAAQHYDERGLGALVLEIALTNLFNRVNVATRQVAGDW